jgi:putative ABC transport system permease protein
MPVAQVPSLDWIQLVVRARPGVDVARAVREAVTAVDPQVPAPVTAPLARAMEMDLLDQKLLDTFLACFALVALALAIAGICAVVAYDVSRRTNEIGVRMAFGAGRHNIVAMILRETLRLTSLGVVMGLALTVAATSLMTRVATQVSAFDPATYLLVVIALVVAIVLGAIVPALRAASVEPSAALRYE